MNDLTTRFSECNDYLTPNPLASVTRGTAIALPEQVASEDRGAAQSHPAWTIITTLMPSAPQPLDEAVVPSDMTAEALQLDRCMADVQRWLGLGLKQAAPLMGISRSTVYAWRPRGSTPRPSTIAAVLNFHALVKYAVDHMGEDEARAWFHSGQPSPIDELLAAEETAQTASVVRNIRRRLFVPEVPPPNRALATTPEDSRTQPANG